MPKPDLTLNAAVWMDRVAQLSAQAFEPEEAMMKQVLAAAEPLRPLQDEIAQAALARTSAMRKQIANDGVEAFLAQYGLDTQEGIAVMCLAEALLRIPDKLTAKQLIRDKFSQGAWNKHLGESDSWLVNVASWGLLLTGTTLKIADIKAESPWKALRLLVKKLGEPTIRTALRHAMEIVGAQFVLGETIEAGVKTSKKAAQKGYSHSFDMLGEGARNLAQAESYFHAYRHAITAIATQAESFDVSKAPSLSVKLSGLHARYQLVQAGRVMSELVPKLKELALLAKQNGVSMTLDAEEANRLDISLMVFYALASDEDLKGWDGLGFVVQAYQKRSLSLIDLLGQLAVATGRRIPIRLVKGAYWDTEIKVAQLNGMRAYPVYTRKEHTDASYLACAMRLLENTEFFYPQFGTHNALSVQSILSYAQHLNVPKERYEFQRLHGMGEALHDALLSEANSRIYAPIGEHKDLLAYLIRRLLENGANSSFVHLLMKKDVSTQELLADPIAASEASGGERHPNVPLPIDIYASGRQNSMGFDLGYLAEQSLWLPAIEKGAMKGLDIKTGSGRTFEVVSPQNNELVVGRLTNCATDEIEDAFTRAEAAKKAWSDRPVQERAELCDKIADAIEATAAPLLALLQQEAGKTYMDAIAEVREAADFCRYYAREAVRIMPEQPMDTPTGERNTLSLHGRGVFVCISPWNFPLAIFTGQVIAALVTGNSVIAKPAEQTPLVAAVAVRIMHDAGVPEEVLQLLCGRGARVGSPLVRHPKTAGVVFTGSEATARIIQRNLADKEGPIVPLIAETGGLNAMIVDSSALLEQACDDIILSAFGSAGQRCSALRLLLVQDEIADSLIEMLKGAMDELRVGDPADMATDVGPVIDPTALQMLEEHAMRMDREATLVAKAHMDESVKDKGTFMLPHIYELPSMDTLNEEVFGPILHIVRFNIHELEAVCEQVNAKGYGLTFGMHSRVDSHIERALATIHAGNCYINRSMIGATVGVQPFGGEGLSGTGMKAGGPYYLLRFVHERTRTINTTAIGGNVELLRASAE